jgi:hypothetical protein
MQKVERAGAITKREFHRRLLTWLSETDDDRVGGPGVDNRTNWIHIID